MDPVRMAAAPAAPAPAVAKQESQWQKSQWQKNQLNVPTLVERVQKIGSATKRFFYQGLHEVAAEVASVLFYLIKWTSLNTAELQSLEKKLPPAIAVKVRATVQHAARYLSDYFRIYLDGASTIASHLRPQWLEYYYNEDTGYTLEATVSRKLLQRHPAEMQQLLETNLLKQALLIKERIAEKMQANPRLMADLVVAHIDALSNHFEKPDQKAESHDLLGKNILGLCLPSGHKSLEVPGPGLCTSLLQKQMYSGLEAKINSPIYQKALEEMIGKHLQEALLHKGATLLKTFVEEGFEGSSMPQSTKEPDIKLNAAIQRLLVSFLKEVSPQHEKLLETFTSVDKLAASIGNKLLGAVEKMDLQVILEQGFAKLLPGLLANNATVPPLPTPEQVKKEKSDRAALKKETQEMIDSIGQKYEGLQKIITAAVDEKKPAAPAAAPASSGFFGAFFSAAAALFGPALAASYIKDVGQKTLSKMQEPRHAQLSSKMIRESVSILRTAI